MLSTFTVQDGSYRRNFAVSIFALAISMLVLAAPSVNAQWLEVAPGVTSPPSQHVGALCFHDGVAWVGTTSLFVSTDTGLTWNQSSSFQSFSGITDIAIYDSLNVLVGTAGDGLFLTTDAGQTWQDLNQGQAIDYSQVAFNGSPSVIHGLSYNASAFFTSTDAGATWNGGTQPTLSGPTGALCFAIAADKTIYVQSYSGGFGWTNTSTDLGNTWSGDGGATDGDSDAISADSCNTLKLYLVNENTVQRSDDEARIDMTSDGGTSWQTLSAHPLNFYSGSIATTPNAIYVGTVKGAGNKIGVERSTDTGMTWENIGGPNEEFDTRTIAAVNDSIVLVLDDTGNVWRTMNSGGFSITIPPKFSVSPDTIFAADTISCDSLNRSVIFTKGCPAPNVKGTSVIGANAASFKVNSLSSDSALVTLYGVTQGVQNAQLVLTLDNGSSDTVLLAGYVNIAPSTLSYSSHNAHTDTLGGTVSVPITINGLTQPEDVDLVLHYDGELGYLGSFSPSGAKLDVPGEQWVGRSELQLTGATTGAVAGFAEFNVFNDSGANSYASFDSLSFLTPISFCEYALPVPIVDTITGLSGCGINILSRLIYLGQTPTFSIQPNPASGNVWITSSGDLGNATITIYDMLGTVRSEVVTGVLKDNPIELPIPDADGVYNIVVKSAGGVSSLRAVRQH